MTKDRAVRRRTLFGAGATTGLFAGGVAAQPSRAAAAAPDPAFDTQVEELVETSSATRTALDGRYVQIAHRPVNLADRLPPGHVASDDATAVVEAALAETSHLEWPGTTLRLTRPVVVRSGAAIAGVAGAAAKIDHAGVGFEVAGALRGVTVQRQTVTVGLGAAGVWVPPGSTGARVEDLDITGDHGVNVLIGGDVATRTGTAVDALIQRVRAGRTEAASSYNFVIDDSRATTLADCVGLGCALDNVKARVHARDYRLVGGRFTGSRGGDGIDAFGGGEGGYIGGGVVFEDNAQNGICVKTDNINGMTLEQQREQLGLPRQTIIDGVIIRRSGGSGLCLHRSDGEDSDYVSSGAGDPSIPVPWLADLSVSSVVIEDPGLGLFINGYNYVIDNLQIIRPRQQGVKVHANARHHRLSRIAVRAAGYPQARTLVDGFLLLGKHLWLSQCAVYGQVGEFVDDASLDTAPKYTRFGFNSGTGTGSTHHFSQCAVSGTWYPALAGEAATHGKHTDGDYESYASGFSLGGLWLRNNAGVLEKSSDGSTGFSPV
ncbi:hypothetical protein ACJ5H2_02720 [Nocardioides sp. R1-1]|uniref:hypothetical protein n=1 Tax=Nocardioides sp. R1-1 TaxID=3383502 RepID=UPI0038D1A9E8